MSRTADSAVEIVSFAEAFARDPEVTIVGIDSVFFTSSQTQEFASETDRAAFRQRWLGRFLKDDARWAYLARAPGQDAGYAVAGYLVGSVADPARAPRFADLEFFQHLADVTARYPAQLHVNLSHQWRGQGIGAALVDRFCADAAREGVKGVHVVTGHGMRNVSFYARCGFREERQLDWNGRTLLFLAKPLN